jgi:hypothetical protein
MEMKITQMSASYTRASFPLRFCSIGVIHLAEIVKRDLLDVRARSFRLYLLSEASAWVGKSFITSSMKDTSQQGNDICRELAAIG